ncbi:MAG: hypothetical protein H6741_13925 [Alphaproteobacteria bacterium]|nr:hypothetical protein [Alphaproteobacteria bacterium]
MLLLTLLISCARPTLDAGPAPLDACDALAARLGEQRSVRALEEAPLGGEPTPAELEDLVHFSERTGWLLHLEDLAARRAQELLTPALMADDRVSPGWVTVPEDGALVVHFLGEVEGQERSLYRARFDPVSERLIGLDPPAEVLAQGPPPAQTLPPEAEPMARALRLATLQDFPLHVDGVRTAVVPVDTARGPGWMVYFLATHPDPGLVLLGGHVAVWVDIEGREVLMVTPHGDAPVLAPRPEPDGPLLRAEHGLTAWPVETHVYTSLRYDLPLCVHTERGWWGVVGARVQFLGA